MPPPTVLDLQNMAVEGVIALDAGAGQWVAPIQASPFLGVSTKQAQWSLKLGNHSGTNGYWIFVPNGGGNASSKCWQALQTWGELTFWNQNGNSAWPPQDWELFRFEAVDVAKNIVKIMQVYGSYVHRIGEKWSAGGNAASASEFKVTFLT